MIDKKRFLLEKRFKIFFESEEAEKLYKKLLVHQCLHCEPKSHSEKMTFRNFKQLQDHVRREHALFYCSICVSHVKLFSSERKAYSRTELATHKRKGDANDKSFKGHPLCELCDNRYLDMDELWKHLRKDHYFCHFCDADGEHIYFNEYAELKEHFREDHFLCEEDQCVNEKFTNAFRSLMDLKGHKALHHMKGAKRKDQKQVRTLELDFNYSDAGSVRRAFRDKKKKESSNITSDDYLEVALDPIKPAADNAVKLSKEEKDAIRAMAASLRERNKFCGQPPQDQVDVGSASDFPTLGSNSASVAGLPKAGAYVNIGKKTLAQAAAGQQMIDDDEEFPTLGDVNLEHSASTKTTLSMAKRTDSIVTPVVKDKNSKWKSTAEEFPALEGATIAPVVHGWHLKKPEPKPKITFVNDAQLAVSSMRDFPSLGNNSVESLIPVGQWASMPKKATSAAEQQLPNKDASEPSTKKLKKKSKTKKQNYDTDSNLQKDIVSVSKSAEMTQHSINSIIRETKSAATFNSDRSDNEMCNFKQDCKANQDQSMTEGNIANKQEKPKSVKKVKKKKQERHADLKQTHDSLKTQLQKEDIMAYDESLKENDSGKESKETQLQTTSDTTNCVKYGTKKKESNISDVEVSHKQNKNSIKQKENKSPSSPDIREKKISSKIKYKPSDNDYPSLRSSAKSMSVDLKPPPGLQQSHPPPGLDRLHLQTVLGQPRPPPRLEGQSASVIKHIATNPPPGFGLSRASTGSSSLNDIASLLTISDAEPETQCSSAYVEPSNFDARNRKLIAKLKETLNDLEKFHKFKNLSLDYRADSVSAKEFHTDCVKLLGENVYNSIFPEMIALLPDISKQQSLYKVSSKSYTPTATSKGWSTPAAELKVCDVCAQVLLATDTTEHFSQHGIENTDFPILSGSSKPRGAMLQAWVKS